ncbi:MAG: amylo-alpha-1,6-glucosidase, partial [Chloroflexota bacterium]
GLPTVLLGSSEEILFESSYLHSNPELSGIPTNGLGILQRNRIADHSVVMEITLANWALKPIEVTLSIELAADFFDSFEARGMKRLKRGELLQPKVQPGEVDLGYEGLDGVKRTTTISVKPPMGRFEGSKMYFDIHLKDGERRTITCRVTMKEDGSAAALPEPVPEVASVPKPAWFDKAANMVTGNSLVDSIIERSVEDLQVLLIEFPRSWVPAAGLPRFAVPFGRDCAITGLETLVWNPHLSHDVLVFLARTQGKEENPWNDEQPGKIMHEMHTGELARLNAIPFGLFYGSVDSTPLFLVLGAEYLRWTGDLKLYQSLEPNFEAAWRWIEDYGDIDGSGYIQYQAHTPPAKSAAALSVGLFNQGWKDSADAVMYADGRMVTDHPIALAEVQGELYRALRLWAELYDSMPGGSAAEANKLRQRADALRERFDREFWMEDRQYYAMALDGSHQQVNSVTSNPAECLWSRLIKPERAAAMIDTLMAEQMFTSWGVRTMSSDEKAYNPLSYHDGSIWPFENALIASGLKKYGFVDDAQRLFAAMLDASLYFEYRRWPEVYCGVSRRTGGVLARQPNASRPQAWSAGAIFMLLQTLLGIAPRPFSKHIDLTPALPDSLRELTVEQLPIAGTTISLRLVKDGASILLEIIDNPGDLNVVLHPATRTDRKESSSRPQH